MKMFLMVVVEVVYNMKAKEYFEKYEVNLMSEDEEVVRDALTSLWKEFNGEMATIRDQRKVSTDRAMVSLIKEMHQKWNSICRCFTAKYNYTTNNYQRLIHVFPSINSF